MSGFKIIAIKTGKKDTSTSTVKGKTVTLNPLKILKENTIYSFDSRFIFENNTLEKARVLESGIKLYDLEIGNMKIPININAIVGKNGSGKSSLIELIYWANYNIGASLGLLVNENTGKKHKPYQIIDLELLYSINDSELLKITIRDRQVFNESYLVENERLISNGEPQPISDRIKLQDFFYSIVINYSQHALNSNEIGNWITPLFHKNDGYQTPIVLNPMRTEGDIFINKENDLLKQRLIANLLESTIGLDVSKSLRNIINDKIATKLVLKFRTKDYAIKHFEKEDDINIKLIKALSDYFKLSINFDLINNDEFLNYCFQELHKKLLKISQKYRPFNRYLDKKTGKIKNVNAFIRQIYKSNSHIVFKVKGLILYMKYFELIFDTHSKNWKKNVTFDIQKLSERIQEIRENFWINTSMLVPPKLFAVDIILNDNLSMDSLSSGEKQKVHSVSSIIYHIINLNSVNKLKDSQITEEEYFGYKYVNLVLDEIELYYHPEWQRSYFSELLNYFAKLNPKNIDKIEGINIMVLTHSPFILSDIPTDNILRIDEGSPKRIDIKTFGANVHDLLAHSFFMNSTIGQFAKEKIANFLEWVEVSEEPNEDEKKYYKSIIGLIGEPVIKDKLDDLYREKLGKPTYEELELELNKYRKN